MQKSSVLIVDDHNLFRKGLRLILEEFENIEIVGELSDGFEFLSFLEIQIPDLVLIDIKMPKLDGISATKKAIALHPGLKVVALSSSDDYNSYKSMVDAGVIGFIIKNSDLSELQTGIQKALSGESYFSQQLLQNVAGTMHFGNNKNEFDFNLSDREIEVLSYICKGMTNAEIGEKLFIQPRTVERHRANLLEKTYSKNSIALVLFALKNGLVKL